jgi:hypothetical protein
MPAHKLVRELLKDPWKIRTQQSMGTTKKREFVRDIELSVS